MNILQRLGVLMALAVGLTGCATNGGSHYENWKNCALTGAVTGGVGVGVIEDDAALASAVIGAIVGGVICARRDSDGDGIRNSKDNCPGSAAGARVDGAGCEIPPSDNDSDSDGDGVLDKNDSCPATPAGISVDGRGCASDSDGDGVENSADECSTTPVGTPVDNRGCELVENYTLQGVSFHTNSDQLTQHSKAILDDAVKIFLRHSDLKAEIAGHTDSQGSESSNQLLSQRRAHTVFHYLVSHGANRHKLSTKGYGESQPVADNTTEEGRARNRRVELRH